MPKILFLAAIMFLFSCVSREKNISNSNKKLVEVVREIVDSEDQQNKIFKVFVEENNQDLYIKGSIEKNSIEVLNEVKNTWVNMEVPLTFRNQDLDEQEFTRQVVNTSVCKKRMLKIEILLKESTPNSTVYLNGRSFSEKVDENGTFNRSIYECERNMNLTVNHPRCSEYSKSFYPSSNPYRYKDTIVLECRK